MARMKPTNVLVGSKHKGGIKSMKAMATHAPSVPNKPKGFGEGLGQGFTKFRKSRDKRTTLPKR